MPIRKEVSENKSRRHREGLLEYLEQKHHPHSATTPRVIGGFSKWVGDRLEWAILECMVEGKVVRIRTVSDDVAQVGNTLPEIE